MMNEAIKVHSMTRIDLLRDTHILVSKNSTVLFLLYKTVESHSEINKTSEGGSDEILKKHSKKKLN